MKKIYKITSVVLCLALLLTCMTVAAYADDTVLLGDVDGSGVVDTRDACEVLRMAAGIIPADAELADMNGDGVVSVEDATQVLYKASNIGGVVVPDKNGDNYLSDDPDNEFIKLVSDTFGVDSAALVAIYSVPDSGTNYVLQFKAKGLINKTYEKSPSNLYRVYHIGAAPERAISYTGGNLVTGNYNCSGAEGVLVFNLVQTKVMQQYPDYFEGV